MSNKWNFTPPGSIPYPAEAYTSAFLGKQKATTPSLAYLEGVPLGSNSIGNGEEYTFTIDFKTTPFTYLNCSNVTTDPAPDMRINIKNIPLGAMFIINGPTSYQPGKRGYIVYEPTPFFNNLLEIYPQNIVKNQLIVRNTAGFVGKNLN